MSIKNVLVTGANRGIGFHLTQKLCGLKSVDHVIATCRNPIEATELNRLLGFNPNLRVLQLDTRDYFLHDKILDDVHKIVGSNGINVLVNNAGIASNNSLSTVTVDAMRENYETNALAPLMITKRLLPLLRCAQQNGLKTSVVNISSSMGSLSESIRDGWNWIPYKTSKAALNMVTKCLSHELSPFGIRVIALHPGWVKTDMGGPNALVEPATSAEGIVNVIENINDNLNGKLVNYQGKILNF